MIGEAEFAAMKPEAVIINVGRGPVIDEAAMVQALSERRIKGAGAGCLRPGAAARRPSALQPGKRAALAALRRPHARLAGAGDAVLHRPVRAVPQRRAADEHRGQEAGILGSCSRAPALEDHPTYFAYRLLRHPRIAGAFDDRPAVRERSSSRRARGRSAAQTRWRGLRPAAPGAPAVPAVDGPAGRARSARRCGRTGSPAAAALLPGTGTRAVRSAGHSGSRAGASICRMPPLHTSMVVIRRLRPPRARPRRIFSASATCSDAIADDDRHSAHPRSRRWAAPPRADPG